MASKILVVEDDATMKEMLRYNLERAGFEVVEAADGVSAVRLAKDQRPDLILMDLMIPELDGVAAARRIRETNTGTPIIMVTALGSESNRLTGFGAGADDYVTKPFSMEELLARVRANLRRARIASTRETEGKLVFGDMEIDPRNYTVKISDEDIVFRTKEFQLLALLASAPGQLFSRQEITEKVWGYDFVGDSRTIDVHIKNVRHRLELHSSYRFIETVRGIGYRFKMSPAKKPETK